MDRSSLRTALVGAAAIVGLILTAIVQARAAEGPCEQIVAACQSAGFVQGDVREGKGLQRDCVGPILQGSAQPPRATLPLPAIDPTIVAACKARNPRLG